MSAVTLDEAAPADLSKRMGLAEFVAKIGGGTILGILTGKYIAENPEVLK